MGYVVQYRAISIPIHSLIDSEITNPRKGGVSNCSALVSAVLVMAFGPLSRTGGVRGLTLLGGSSRPIGWS